MKYDVFISYRRDGGYDTAKHLNDLLVRDGYGVSFDIDTLRSGDFDTQLFSRIDECKDFILIVDQHAFDRSLDPNFDPKHDWLRSELAYALQHDKNIIPIFLSGVTDFPAKLPEDIAQVVKKNGPEYNKYHFNAFYEDLKKRFLISKSSKSSIKLIILPVLALTLIVASGFWYYYRPTESPSSPPEEMITDSIANTDIIEKKVDINFYGKKNNSGAFFGNLYAKVDGYEYKIDIPEDICFNIYVQEDFDNDGIVDALIQNIQACGGNAMGNSFFFVSYTGDGYFSVSNSFGNNVWYDPVVEDWKGQKSVVIIDSNQGFNTDEKYSIKERYILKQGSAVRVESSKKNSIIALQEIKAADFHDGKEYETLRMSCDLDDNGDKDFIECKYWDRWDALFFDIILNGKRLDCDNYDVYRIGILSSKTNGMHDLVCNESDIVKWDGTKYDFDMIKSI